MNVNKTVTRNLQPATSNFDVTSYTLPTTVKERVNVAQKSGFVNGSFPHKGKLERRANKLISHSILALTDFFVSLIRI